MCWDQRWRIGIALSPLRQVADHFGLRRVLCSAEPCAWSTRTRGLNAPARCTMPLPLESKHNMGDTLLHRSVHCARRRTRSGLSSQT